MIINAMIPARLGSKRVYKKNIRMINNKPLIQYIIDTVKKTKIFDNIYLNSESLIFKKIANKNSINFYHRNKKLSSDRSTNDEFALDFIENIKGDILIQILPTSPLLLDSEVKEFVNYFKQNKLDTLISVQNHKIASVYKKKPINFNKYKKNPPSQKMQPIQTYATVLMGWKYKNYKKNMLKYNSAYHGGEGKIDYFPLTPLSCLDIDYEEDFQLVEKIIIANTNKRYKAKYFK